MGTEKDQELFASITVVAHLYDMYIIACHAIRVFYSVKLSGIVRHNGTATLINIRERQKAIAHCSFTQA
jgi:hypothetical protein